MEKKEYHGIIENGLVFLGDGENIYSQEISNKAWLDANRNYLGQATNIKLEIGKYYLTPKGIKKFTDEYKSIFDKTKLKY